jgi:hypothetical protein
VKENDGQYIKIYHIEVNEGSNKTTGCSTLIGLQNQSFKNFNKIVSLNDENQTSDGF